MIRKSLAVSFCMTVSVALVLVGLSACDGGGAPAPVFHLGMKPDSASGAMMIRAGDTLWSISQRYRLPLRDIIDTNALVPPYVLSEGQRLKLPPPMDYTVEERDTLYGVARMFGVPVSRLVKVNNISVPYRLRPGQVLRIPSSLNRLQQAKETEPFVPVVRESVPAANAPRRQAVEVAPHAIKGQMGVAKKPAVMISPAAPAPIVTAEPKNTGPLIWPVRGKIISVYGPKEGGLYNDGVNIAAPRGTPVKAAGDGVVAYVGSALESYGTLVLVRHGKGLVTAYAHLGSVGVRTGTKVRKGQAIGSVGSTGTVATSQLHFEIRRGTDTVDPQKYMKS